MNRNVEQTTPRRTKLNPGRTAIIYGGRLWPYFDLKKIFAQIQISEDIDFKTYLRIQ